MVEKASKSTNFMLNCGWHTVCNKQSVKAQVADNIKHLNDTQ